VAATKAHPAQAVAARLIQAIAPSTDLLRLGDPTLLLCKRCLTRCTDHRAALPWTPDVPYFGCRRCHQSREFFKVEQVVALLDEEAEARPQQQGSTLSVPWRPGQPLFDFDTVIIRQASDETVERFAVQLGNDTDPFRQPRTREMRCVIAPSCHLSANTQRILQRTFAQVAVESISTPSREDTPATREAVDRLTEAESREEQSRRD
jgi:hypothetical protein